MRGVLHTMGLGVYEPDKIDVVLVSGPARRWGGKYTSVSSNERISRQGLGQVQVAFFLPKQSSPSPSQLGAGRLDIHLQSDIPFAIIHSFGRCCSVWTGLTSEPSSIFTSCSGLIFCSIFISSFNSISCSNLLYLAPTGCLAPV
jgi:hypothetical protein